MPLYESLGSPVSSGTAEGSPNTLGMSGDLTGTTCDSDSTLGAAFTSTLAAKAETMKKNGDVCEVRYILNTKNEISACYY